MSAIVNFFRDLYRSESAEEREWGPYALEDMLALSPGENDTPEEKAALQKLNKLTPRQSRRVRVRAERARRQACRSSTTDLHGHA